MVKWLLIFTLFWPWSSQAYTILIDPGHGGEDEGATARYYYGKKKWKLVKEKDIALELAKKIHRKLSKKYNSFLTRSIDRNVGLHERAQMAEKLKANLFISVHINSSSGKNPRGFETYYLDNHQDSAVHKVEKIENRELKGEELEVNKILIDLAIERTVKTSKALANHIHSEIHKLVGKRYRLINRGVKPALFYVLALTKRPGILLEVGFLSNSKELKKLLNPKFQERYAEAVTRGIEKYLKGQDKLGPPLL